MMGSVNRKFNRMFIAFADKYSSDHVKHKKKIEITPLMICKKFNIIQISFRSQPIALHFKPCFIPIYLFTIAQSHKSLVQSVGSAKSRLSV